LVSPSRETVNMMDLSNLLNYLFTQFNKRSYVSLVKMIRQTDSILTLGNKSC